MNKKGFTLIELLATITIIGVIMVILFPSVKNLIQNNENIQLDSVKKVLQSAADKYIVDERIDFKCYSKDSTLQSKLNNSNINCLNFGKTELEKYISSNKFNNLTIDLSNTSIYVYCSGGKKNYYMIISYNQKKGSNITYSVYRDGVGPYSCNYNLARMK